MYAVLFPTVAKLLPMLMKFLPMSCPRTLVRENVRKVVQIIVLFSSVIFFIFAIFIKNSWLFCDWFLKYLEFRG